MNKSPLLFCLLTMIIVFTSCKEDSLAENKVQGISIVGTWELRQAQSGMTPTTNYAAGNGNILKFSDSTYEMYTNGALTQHGTYVLINDSTVTATVGIGVPADQFTTRIVYDNYSSAPKKFIDVSNGKLSFLFGYYPLDTGSKMIYEKQ